MDSKVLLSGWGGLFRKTEVIVAKQPHSAVLTVIF